MTEYHFATVQPVWDWLQANVAAGRPEAGCAILCRPMLGNRRHTLILFHVVEPQPGDVEFRNGPVGHGLYFDTEYLARVQNEAVQKKAGIVLVHNHPHDPTPKFSGRDLESEKALLAPLLRATGQPGGALLLGANATVRARIWFPGDRRPRSVECLRINGLHLTMKWTADAKLAAPAVDVQDRAIRLWGKDGQQVLQNLRVGQAGAGGVASQVAEGLARLGIGEIVQADEDLIEAVNVTRNAGSRRRDVGQPKVSVLKRWLRQVATAPGFRYTARQTKAENALKDLLDCDVIVSAVDGYATRAFLNDLAYRYFLPVVDCGTQLLADPAKGVLQHGVLRAQLLQPLGPCLWCTGFLTRQRISDDLLPPEVKKLANYGVEDHAPAVYFTNAITAGMVGMLVLEHILHLTGLVPGELRYNVRTWILSPESDPIAAQCRCGKLWAHGDQDLEGDAQ